MTRYVDSRISHVFGDIMNPFLPLPGIQITRIKEKVEEQSGVPPQQQRLIFSGRQMCVYTMGCVARS